MSQATTTVHQSVMMTEVMECFDYLSEIENPVFLDCTLGGAGHSEALLKKYPDLFVLAIDQDPDALERAKVRLTDYSDRLILARCNFRDLDGLISELFKQKAIPYRSNLKLFDGIIADLGISSDQLADPDRGFSFLQNSPLDMRMDPSSEQGAASLLNESSKSELQSIFRTGGVGAVSGVLAAKVVESRPINSTSEFASICESIGELNTRPGRSAATVPFQAVRIAVNDELGAARELIDSVHQFLSPGASVCVISFHSLEDKIVAKGMRSWERGEQVPRRIPQQGGVTGIGKLLTKKALSPREEEIGVNPRARSSMMRIFRRNEKEVGE